MPHPLPGTVSVLFFAAHVYRSEHLGSHPAALLASDQHAQGAARHAQPVARLPVRRLRRRRREGPQRDHRGRGAGGWRGGGGGEESAGGSQETAAAIF